MKFEDLVSDLAKILVLQPEEVAGVRPQTLFRELPNWDSIAAINLIVVADRKYGVRITAQDFRKLGTLDDVFRRLCKS